MVGSLAEFRTRREAQMVLDFLYIKGNVDYNNNYIEKSFITDNYNKCEFEIVNV